jgi:hypothetical protein
VAGGKEDRIAKSAGQVSGHRVLFRDFARKMFWKKIMKDVEGKKKHKFAMLGQFVNLLEEYSDS